MSERPDSDEQPDPEEIPASGEKPKRRYLTAVARGLAMLFVRLWQTKREEASNSEQQRADEHLIAAATNKMARYTGWLVAATVASVVTAVLTLVILNRDSNRSEETDRAFVFARDILAISGIAPDGKSINVEFVIPWENSGTTPTRKLNVGAICGGPDIVGTPPIDFKKSVGPTKRQMMIGPKAVENDYPCEAGSYAVFKTIESWQNWRVYGAARYSDVYGKPHITEICYDAILRNKRKTAEGMTADIYFTQCEGVDSKHNCSDHECPKEDW